jgi:short-subunit dehydrogenase
MESRGTTILITGATAGIGRHAALYLAERGHRVIATGRNEKALEALRSEGRAVETVRLDVTNAASIAEAAAQVDRLTEGRGIDVLINNAGYGLAGAMEEITDEDLRAQFETNVFGLMSVTRAFLPAMRRRGSGRILNVSSVGGRVTFPLFGPYHATKYAVEALSDALRMELRPFGIKVVLIEPGPIKTEFSQRSYDLVSRYDKPSSPYASVYARAGEIKQLADKQSVSPEKVSRVMERAIRRRNPRARYVTPFTSRLMLGTLLRLPTGFRDWLMTKVVGLTTKKMVKGAAPLPAIEPKAENPAAAAR